MGCRAVVVAAAVAVAALSIVGNAAAAGITLGADGETAPVFSYADAIRERVWVPVAGVDQNGDGVTDRVALEIMRPLETNSGLKVPAIVDPSPYYTSVGRGNDTQWLHTTGSAPDLFPMFYDNYFVPRGYAVVLAEADGTGWSTGCPLHGGPGDIAAMKAVIHWLMGRVQGFDAVTGGNLVTASWDNGKNAMIGKSYDGTLANGVAATGVDGLTTVVPISGISDWYDYSRSNGVRYNPAHYPASLSSSITQNQPATRLGVVPPDNNAPCAGTRTTMSTEDGDATGDVNDFWRDRDYTQNVANVHASVFISFGLNDDNVNTSQLSTWWAGLAANNVPRKLWLSQEGHVDPFDYDRAEWVDTLHRWFDYWLQGVSNGIMLEPRVKIERSTDVFQDEADWPAAGTSGVNVFLHGTTAGSPGTLGNASGGGSTDSLTFTDLPTQRESTMLNSPDGSQANRLTFLSPVLRHDMRISGVPSVDLQGSFNKADGNLGVMLVDYSDAPFTMPTRNDGISSTTTRTCWGDSTATDSACFLEVRKPTASVTNWLVSKGILDAQNRDSLTAPTPMVAGQTYTFRFPLLAYDYVFPAGHRIGVVVVSNYQDYGAFNESTDTSSPTAVVTVDTRLSKIVLPVVGGDAAARDAGVFVDTTPPTLHVPAPIALEATAPSTPVTYSATATDDLDGSPTVSCDHASGSGFPLGTTTVTCTATDAGGNASPPASFTVTVRDTTRPTLTLPAAQTVEAASAAGAAVTFAAGATDLADPSPAVTCTPGTGSTFPLGRTTVSCTATDASGNGTSGTFAITVRDTMPPTLSLPGATTVEATSPTGALVAYAASATDAVDADPSLSCLPASGTRFALGVTTVSCSSTDANGNTANGSFTVTVADTTGPVLTLPAPISLQAANAGGSTVTYTVTATDALDAHPAVSCAPASGTTFPIGATTVSCTATDAGGNVTPGSFTVTVTALPQPVPLPTDTTAPVLRLPNGPVSQEATGANGATVAYAVTGIDAVDGATAVSCSPAAGSVFPIGTTTVRCTTTDRAGNAAVGSFDVSIVDTTAPTLRLPGRVVAKATARSGAVVRFTARASDLVDPAPSVSCVPASGTTFHVGRTLVRCTATDAAGNAARGSFAVEVAGPAQQLAALHTAKARAVLRQLRAGHHRTACTLARRAKLTRVVRLLGC